jgi:AmiR/NasT family two-component response regulator
MSLQSLNGTTQALEVERFRVENEQLRHALQSRIIIEQPKGVIAVLRDMTPDEAFVLLRHQAQSSRRNIHDVATEVVAARQFTG